MPVNKDSVKKIYADALVSPKVWNLTATTQGTTTGTGTGQTAPTTGNTSTAETGLIFTGTGKSWMAKDSGKTTRNYASGGSSGTTQWDIKDIGQSVTNLEVTCVINVGGCSDETSLKVYGPDHNDGACCFLIMNVDNNSGKFQLGGEGPHPDTDKTNRGTGQSIGSMKNKRVAIKGVFWIDSQIHARGYYFESGSWSLKLSADFANFGDNKTANKPASKNNVQFRTDCNGVEMIYAGAAEIQAPSGSPSTIPGTGGGTGGSAGGAGSGGGGVSMSGESKIRLGGNAKGLKKTSGDVWTLTSGDDYAVLSIPQPNDYKPTGLVTNESELETRRYMQDSNDWRHVEMTGYFMVTASSNGRIAMTCKGGNQAQNKCEGFGYSANIFFSGNTQFYKTQWFNGGNVFTVSKPGVGSDIESRWIGIKFVVWDDGSNVKMEIWIDEGESGSWKRVDSFVDNGNWGNAGGQCGGQADQIGTWGGPFAHFKWEGATNVDFKYLSVREIKGGVRFSNEAGSNSGNSSGTGGGGTSSGGSNTSSGGSTGSGSGGQGSSGSGDSDGGIIGSGGGDTAEPAPLETVYNDLVCLFNVNVDTNDYCSQGQPMETRDPIMIYDTDVADIEQEVGYGTGLGVMRIGMYVKDIYSSLYNQPIKKVTVRAIKRVLDAGLNSPVGNVKMLVMSLNSGIPRAQIGATVAANAIDLNYVSMDFVQPDNNYQMQVGDALFLEYSDVSASTLKHLKIKYTERDVTDGPSTHLYTYKATGHVVAPNQGKDCAFTVYM